MNQMLAGQIIRAIENGLVPDAVTRLMIRQLCRQRLAATRREYREFGDEGSEDDQQSEDQDSEDSEDSEDTGE